MKCWTSSLQAGKIILTFSVYCLDGAGAKRKGVGMGVFDDMRQLNMASLILRLSLAVIFGGMIGMERGRKHRAAGMRTYMLVCMGAAMTVMLGQYETLLLTTVWHEQAKNAGVMTDVARFGAQVISGIGFLGAGTIIVTGRREIKGLTTAAGLWASACMGLAIGAGFYECVVLAFMLIFLSIRILPRVELAVVEHAKNMNIYVEMSTLDKVSDVLSCLKELDVQIHEVEIDRGEPEERQNPGAVFAVRLSKKTPHEHILSALSGVEGVLAIEEI